MQEDLLNKPVGGELTEEERVIFEQELLDTINTQWEHLSVAEFDKPSKTYTITPTTEVFISFIIGSIEGIPETLEMWGVFGEGLAIISDNLIPLLGEGYTFVILDPNNHENYVLYVKDGVIEYDYPSEVNGLF